jgi:hypothetical protein
MSRNWLGTGDLQFHCHAICKFPKITRKSRMSRYGNGLRDSSLSSTGKLDAPDEEEPRHVAVIHATVQQQVGNPASLLFVKNRNES